MSQLVYIQLTQEDASKISGNLPERYFLRRLRGKPNSRAVYLNKSNIKIEQTPYSQSPKIQSQQPETNTESTKEQQNNVKVVKSIAKSNVKTNSDLTSNKKELETKLLKILDKIIKKQSSDIFIQPVNPIKLQIPTYFSVIKEPMDLSTMKKKVKTYQYTSMQLFEADLRKIVLNCLKFNGQDSVFKQITSEFQKDYKLIIQQFQKTQKKSAKSAKIQNINKTKNRNQQPTQENSQEQETPSTRNHKIDVQKEQKPQSKVKNESQNGKKKTINIEKQTNSVKQQTNPVKKQTNSVKKQKVNVYVDQNDKKSVTKLRKKYSIQDRLLIIGRIRTLDHETMRNFFQAINFSQGQTLDFKILEDEKIVQIEKQLIQFQKIYQNKLKHYNKNQETEGEFQIAQDQDFQK